MELQTVTPIKLITLYRSLSLPWWSGFQHLCLAHRGNQSRPGQRRGSAGLCAAGLCVLHYPGRLLAPGSSFRWVRGLHRPPAQPERVRSRRLPGHDDDRATMCADALVDAERRTEARFAERFPSGFRRRTGASAQRNTCQRRDAVRLAPAVRAGQAIASRFSRSATSRENVSRRCGGRDPRPASAAGRSRCRAPVSSAHDAASIRRTARCTGQPYGDARRAGFRAHHRRWGDGTL